MGAGDVRVDFDEEGRWLVLTRGPVTVACNLGPDRATLSVPPGEVVLSSVEDPVVADGRAVLPPESVLVLRTP